MQRLSISSDSTIENAFSGDGDDVLIGNQADNHLHGGRGNDRFVATGGDDTITGGRGFDQITYNLIYNEDAAKSDVSIEQNDDGD